jgi:NhaP-type Na+/H+ or K+/H+ antiporter
LGAALLQSGTETLSGFTTLLFYLVPAGVGLGLVIAVIVRRRRRGRREGGER